MDCPRIEGRRGGITETPHRMYEGACFGSQRTMCARRPVGAAAYAARRCTVSTAVYSPHNGCRRYPVVAEICALPRTYRACSVARGFSRVLDIRWFGRERPVRRHAARGARACGCRRVAACMLDPAMEPWGRRLWLRRDHCTLSEEVRRTAFVSISFVSPSWSFPPSYFCWLCPPARPPRTASPASACRRWVCRGISTAGHLGRRVR